MFWQGALPRKFANFKVQNDECHYFGVEGQEVPSQDNVQLLLCNKMIDEPIYWNNQ
jgi:hypothetical protein